MLSRPGPLYVKELLAAAINLAVAMATNALLFGWITAKIIDLIRKYRARRASPPVRRVSEALAAHGHVRRGLLGVGTMPVRLGADQEKALGQASALLVTSVQPDTGAGRGGVLLGDALLAFAGHPLHRPGDLFARLDEEAIGRTVTLRLLRAGAVQDVPVTISARDCAELARSVIPPSSDPLPPLPAAPAAARVGADSWRERFWQGVSRMSLSDPFGSRLASRGDLWRPRPLIGMIMVILIGTALAVQLLATLAKEARCNQALRLALDHRGHPYPPIEVWFQRLAELDAAARITCGEDEFNAEIARWQAERHGPGPQ
jgi:hypothetical protein